MSPALANKVLQLLEGSTSLLGPAIELTVMIEKLAREMQREQQVILAEFLRNSADRVENRPKGE